MHKSLHPMDDRETNVSRKMYENDSLPWKKVWMLQTRTRKLHKKEQKKTNFRDQKYHRKHNDQQNNHKKKKNNWNKKKLYRYFKRQTD